MALRLAAVNKTESDSRRASPAVLTRLSRVSRHQDWRADVFSNARCEQSTAAHLHAGVLSGGTDWSCRVEDWRRERGPRYVTGFSLRSDVPGPW